MRWWWRHAGCGDIASIVIRYPIVILYALFLSAPIIRVQLCVTAATFLSCASLLTTIRVPRVPWLVCDCGIS